MLNKIIEEDSSSDFDDDEIDEEVNMLQQVELMEDYDGLKDSTEKIVEHVRPPVLQTELLAAAVSLPEDNSQQDSRPEKTDSPSLINLSPQHTPLNSFSEKNTK